MARFLVVRVSLIFVTLLAVSLIIFSATEFLPGDAASILLGQQATPTNLENLRHRMGLDRGAHVRYLGWIVGWPESEGTLFRTRDGGATWQGVGAGTITPMTRTSFISPKLGWAISEKNIYSTEDGGARWTRQLRSENWLRAIAFVDEKNGLAVGAGGIIYRTAEGGVPSVDQGQVLCAGSTCDEELLSTWDPVDSGTTSALTDIAFANDSRFWIAGERGLVLRSTDGGVTWETVDTGVDATLLSVAFASVDRGVVVGEDGTVLWTADGGRTWQPTDSGITSPLNGVAFAGDATVWAVGDGGTVLFSGDSGVTWTSRTIDPSLNSALDAVSFDDAVGVIVGAEGTVWTTSDGGASWTRQEILEAGDGTSDGQLEPTARPLGGVDVHVSQVGTAVIVVEAVGVSAPTTYVVERFALEDGPFELSVGAEAKWGYAARKGIRSDKQDIVMTVKVGDTIRFERLSSNSSRSTVEHAFTIVDLGIDERLQPGDVIEPYELLLDQVGTFTITDSANSTEVVTAWATSDDTVWQWGLLGGDLGVSPRSGVSITSMIKSSLPNSAILAVAAFLVAIPTSLAAGVWVGVHPHTKLDRILSQGSLLTISLPEFVTGLLLILVFASWLDWLPSSSIMLPGESVWSRPEVLVLPIITVTGALFAYILRMARANVIEVMNSNYVRTAILKGLPMRQVVIRHVLPNALLPTITVIANNVGYLFGGLIITESIFAYPGVGRLLLMAINTRDVRLLQSTALIIASVVVFSNLAADLIYGALNPRIRLA